jgi:hypothetical protein
MARGGGTKRAASRFKLKKRQYETDSSSNSRPRKRQRLDKAESTPRQEKAVNVSEPANPVTPQANSLREPRTPDPITPAVPDRQLAYELQAAVEAEVSHKLKTPKLYTLLGVGAPQQPKTPADQSKAPTPLPSTPVLPPPTSIQWPSTPAQRPPTPVLQLKSSFQPPATPIQQPTTPIQEPKTPVEAPKTPSKNIYKDWSPSSILSFPSDDENEVGNSAETDILKVWPFKFSRLDQAFKNRRPSIRGLGPAEPPVRPPQIQDHELDGLRRGAAYRINYLTVPKISSMPVHECIAADGTYIILGAKISEDFYEGVTWNDVERVVIVHKFDVVFVSDKFIEAHQWIDHHQGNDLCSCFLHPGAEEE